MHDTERISLLFQIVIKLARSVSDLRIGLQATAPPNSTLEERLNIVDERLKEALELARKLNNG